MNDSYFGTKTSMWVRNATFVKEAKTSADALKLAKLDFDVLQESIFDTNGYVVDGYRLNRKSDDGRILGLVSDRYKVVQNTDAFAFTDGLIGPDCRYENAGSTHGYRIIWLQAKLRPRTIMGDD